MNFINKIHYKKVFLVLAVFGLFLLRVFSLKLISIDSDEVMWSLMANKIISGEKNYIYFASQNFRGSLEAYIIAPFQYTFGINVFSLRVSNLIFNTLTGIFVYLTMFKLVKIKSKGYLVFSFVAFVLYFLFLPRNLVIHTKAWGNYSFIEFTCIFSFYILLFKLIKSKSTQFIWLIVLGVTLALSFWANMQSLYFIFIVLFFAFIKDIEIIKTYSLKKVVKDRFYVLVVLLNLFFSFVNLYFLYKKKSIFNPAITLNQKLGFTVSSEVVNFFNIYYINIIYFMFVLFVFYVLYSFLIKRYYFVYFLFLVNFAFVGIAVNIFHNSLNRVSAGGGSIFSVVIFLHKIIFTSFYGQYYLLFLLPIFAFLFYRLPKFIKTKKIESIDIYLVAFFAFLVMFLLSSVPQLTPTPRYLIIWWPVSVIVFVYSLYWFSTAYLFRKKTVIFYFPLTIFIFLYLVIIFKNISVYKQYKFIADNQKKEVNLQIQNTYFDNKVVCKDNYWAIGPIMFYSKGAIQCFEDPKINNYLDDY